MPTTTELLELDGLGTRRESVQFELLDQSLTTIGELNPARPATMTNNPALKIPRTIRALVFPDDEAQDIDTVKNFVRPSWVLENGALHALGVLGFADAANRRRFDPAGDRLPMEATLADRMLQLGTAISEGVGFDTGQGINAALIALAGDAGIVDTTGITVTGTIAAPIAWEIGTGRRSIMDELSNLGGGHPIYFDNNGLLIARTAPPIDSVTPAFTLGADTTVVADTIVEADTLLESPNVWIALETSAKDAPIVGRYELPASAPHSIANRGFEDPKVTRHQGLETVTAVNAAAEADAISSTEAFSIVELETTPAPRWETFDVASWLGSNYMSVDWSLALDPGGRHAHSLRRLYPST